MTNTELNNLIKNGCEIQHYTPLHDEEGQEADIICYSGVILGTTRDSYQDIMNTIMRQIKGN